MKKYLMGGIAALTLCAGFTSCSHDDFEPMTQAEIDKAKYDMAFLNYVGGKIDKNQDWGFGSATRTLTRGNAGNGDLGNQTWKNFGADDLENITDDERKAVLAAIAEKVTGSKISEDVVFPWTDYFLQDVVSGVNGDFEGAGSNGTSSASYTFEAYSKGEFCDPNGQYDNSNKHRYQWGWNNDTNSPNYFSQEEYEAEHSNYAEVANSGHITNMYVHENEDKSQTQIKETALMTNMEYGTYEEMKGRQFRWYINCHGYRHWSEYIVVQVNGNYYICFDFACGYPENNYDGHPERGAEYNDWDYNDWVLKITPAGNQPDVWDGTPEEGEGEGEGETETEEEVYNLRIIAEDLSANTGTDFDFNDVVFDVKYGSPVTIKLLAAGGTLPLYINGQEVHGLFKAETTEMVNTNADGGVERDPVVLTLEGVSVTTPEEANKNIVITVEKNGVEQTLTAEKGEAACKIAVDTNFQWLDERVSIKDTYENFVNWVNGSFTGKWW